MKTEQAITERINELHLEVKVGTKLLQDFRDGRHLFSDLDYVEKVFKKLVENTCKLRTLLWVIE